MKKTRDQKKNHPKEVDVPKHRASEILLEARLNLRYGGYRGELNSSSLKFNAHFNPHILLCT